MKLAFKNKWVKSDSNKIIFQNFKIRDDFICENIYIWVEGRNILILIFRNNIIFILEERERKRVKKCQLA